jgi:hypothetical protein
MPSIGGKRLFKISFRPHVSDSLNSLRANWWVNIWITTDRAAFSVCQAASSNCQCSTTFRLRGSSTFLTHRLANVLHSLLEYHYKPSPALPPMSHPPLPSNRAKPKKQAHRDGILLNSGFMDLFSWLLFQWCFIVHIMFQKVWSDKGCYIKWIESNPNYSKYATLLSDGWIFGRKVVWTCLHVYWQLG